MNFEQLPVICLIALGTLIPAFLLVWWGLKQFIKGCKKYRVYIKYTDDTNQISHCYGNDRTDALIDLLTKIRYGVYSRVDGDDGYTELKTIKAYKLGEEINGLDNN